MKRDPVHTKVVVAQGLAALAYFFCVHGAHAAPAVQAQATVDRAAVAAVQPRPV
jgi:hypothetical protein